MPGASHQLLCAVHDTVERTWRHLDFFQYQTELVARVPRVSTPEGKVARIEVPWARPGSGFTLLMEAWAMLLCEAMPVKEAAELLGESDTRLWRLVAHYVEAAHAKRDWSKVRRILLDETSARKGYRYVTSVVDADNRIEHPLFNSDRLLSQNIPTSYKSKNFGLSLSLSKPWRFFGF